MLTKKGKTLLSIIDATQDRKQKSRNAKLEKEAKKWAEKRISELAKKLRKEDAEEEICILEPSESKLTDYELMQIDAFCDALGITGLMRKVSYVETQHFVIIRMLTISIHDFRELLLAAQEKPEENS